MAPARFVRKARPRAMLPPYRDWGSADVIQLTLQSRSRCAMRATWRSGKIA